MTRSGIMAAAAAFGMFASSAQAACWTEGEIAAARVRSLETMIMVSSLRCRLKGDNFISSYNHFIRSHRTTLTEANDRLRTHFAASAGAGQALNAYDRYVTGIANRYGGGAAGLGCEDVEDILQSAQKHGSSLDHLDRVAAQAGVEPQMQGGRCPRTMASR